MCLLSRHACWHTHVRKHVYAGGELNFYYDFDQLGMPHWVDTTKQTEAWLKQRGYSDLPKHVWEMDEAELRPLSFEAKFVNMLISGGAKCEKNRSVIAFCNKPPPNATLSNIQSPHSCCWALPGFQKDLTQLQREVGQTIDQLLKMNDVCMDAPTDDFFRHPEIPWLWANVILPSLADGLGKGDVSCNGGCLDRFRPFCRSGQCVTPTCQDAKRYCHDSS